MTEVPGGSKGVAFTNWLVSKAAGVLERKSSRRGFIMGSAMVGSAVAVAGCAPGTQPGTPYKHITDCAGGLCTDGYTEFCCTINNGINACPPGTFVAGWWRADYSSFCNGTRYYMDCNEFCCGPNLGNGFCAGCHEARCAGGCDTRRVYANYFRYGQCHQEIGALGPIACRLVTCTPPYTVAEYACTTALAVDNSTAEHAPAHGCTPTLSPIATALPALGAAATSGPAAITGFTRFPDSFIYANTFANGQWSGWFKGSPAITSGITSAADATGTYVIGRAVDNQVRYNRLVNGAWAGEGVLGGINPTSNPVAASSPTGIYLAVRTADKSVAWGRFLNGTWSGWSPLGGYVNSNPTMVATQWGIFLFARGGDNALYVNRCQGTSWSGWSSLGGIISADPTCAVDSSGVYVFARLTDNAVWGRKWSGGSWLNWFSLGGNITSDPVAVRGPANDVCVFARGINKDAWVNRLSGSWSGFRPLGGTIDTSMSVVTGPSSVFVFARGLGGGVWAGQYANGQWFGWYPLGGTSSPANALS